MTIKRRITSFDPLSEVDGSETTIIHQNGITHTTPLSGLSGMPHGHDVSQIAAIDPKPALNTYLCGNGTWQATQDQVDFPTAFLDDETFVPDWCRQPTSRLTGEALLSALSFYADQNASASDSRFSHATTADGVYAGDAGYCGAVLLMDGHTVFVAPHVATQGVIYDIDTNTVSLAPALSGSKAFAGAVLLKTGNVFLVPHNSSSARIYDPISGLYSVTIGTYSGSASYRGGTLLLDGRVYCFPYRSSHACIYDPILDSTTTPAGIFETNPGTAMFSGGVLLANGKVFISPCSANHGCIYDPVANTLVSTATFSAVNDGYHGAVLLTDGRVFLVPHNATQARIYNPNNDSWALAAGLYSGSQEFEGGVLTPSGQVFMVPYSSTSIALYNPATGLQRRLSLPAPINPGSAIGRYAGGLLLPTGQIWCTPYNDITAMLYLPEISHKVYSPRLLTSPYLNHA